jgi:RND family efflux transporter MFP subunit
MTSTEIVAVENPQTVFADRICRLFFMLSASYVMVRRNAATRHSMWRWGMARRCAVLAVTGGLVFFPAGCDQPPVTEAGAQQPPQAVTVALPVAKQITEWDEFTGRFEATEIVEVRARVSGVIKSVHFRDGDRVEAGKLLFVIDPRPFQIALEGARAGMKQAQAQLQLAKSDLSRAVPLARRSTIPERELEARQATRDAAAGLLAGAEAQVKKAALDLEWTEVRAPIAGRISDARIDVGNLITGSQSDSTLLTTIVSLDPIQFVFEGSEADYLKYQRLDSAGQRPSSRDARNPVAVKLVDETAFTHTGTMDFVDNALDPNSGTIRARAIIDNKSGFLVPGLFGRLRLFGGRSRALLIPDAAIMSDQARKIVLTVADDGTVLSKLVTLGPLIDGLRVVRSGIESTDRVIINGVQRARPGEKVTPQSGAIAVSSADGN